jgi:hypothetical protein
LICSDYKRESIRHVKCILLLFVYKTYVLQLISRYYKSSYTVLVVNISIVTQHARRWVKSVVLNKSNQ